MAEQFTGSGWSFPMRIGPTGGIALVSGEREIEEAIRLVLATAPGERPMRPEFGCAIHDLVFAPVNEATAGRIQHQVYTSLDRWEPRVEVHDVEVTAGDDPGVLFIDVRYAIRGTNNPRSLVFPFYVIPSHDAPGAPGAPDFPDSPGSSGPHSPHSPHSHHSPHIPPSPYGSPHEPHPGGAGPATESDR